MNFEKFTMYAFLTILTLTGIAGGIYIALNILTGNLF